MNIDIPYNYSPRPYQSEYHRAMLDKKRAFIILHRRAGKTLMLWQDTIVRAVKKLGLYYYVLPTYEMCKKIIWTGMDGRTGMRMLDYIPDIIIDQTNATELSIKLKNGSIIQLVGSDNYDRLRGTNPVDIKLDEYPEQRPEVWDTLRPILAENGGTATFAGTPKGMNHAWDLLQKVQNLDTWFVMIKNANETGVIPLDVLENERKEMSQDMFDQEFMCKFLEGASQFFRHIESRVGTNLDYDDRTVFRMGLDIAGHGGDWTVVTLLNANNGQVIKQERWQKTDYTDQEARIEAIWLRYGKPEVVLDATGVGQAFYDYISKRINNVYPFTFTEKSRDQLLRNLQILLEKGEIWINNDEGLMNELKAMRYEISDTGKVKVLSPENIHDDRVMSLALSVWQFEKQDLARVDNRSYNVEDRYSVDKFLI